MVYIWEKRHKKRSVSVNLLENKSTDVTLHSDDATVTIENIYCPIIGICRPLAIIRLVSLLLPVAIADSLRVLSSI